MGKRSGHADQPVTLDVGSSATAASDMSSPCSSGRRAWLRRLLATVMVLAIPRSSIAHEDVVILNGWILKRSDLG